jgi:hypothetical protein
MPAPCPRPWSLSSTLQKVVVVVQHPGGWAFGGLRVSESLQQEFNERGGNGLGGLSVSDCYYCANRCLDMWNDSVDHAARSELLRMAHMWLQLASESDNHRRAEH